MELDPMEIRLLGCLVEKEMTTPDYYPMTVNALAAAANQKTNRTPVVTYTESEVLEAVNRLRERGLVRAVRTPGGRAAKYKHALDDALEVDPQQAALLAVLMLRGEQTAGEIRLRTERYHDFESVEAVELVLGGLEGREIPLAERLVRRPGEKEARYRHLLGGAPTGDALGEVPVVEPGLPATGELEELRDRIHRLEQRVTDLEGRVIPS